jgi:hypothetical protein
MFGEGNRQSVSSPGRRRSFADQILQGGDPSGLLPSRHSLLVRLLTAGYGRPLGRPWLCEKLHSLHECPTVKDVSVGHSSILIDRLMKEDLDIDDGQGTRSENDIDIRPGRYRHCPNAFIKRLRKFRCRGHTDCRATGSNQL